MAESEVEVKLKATGADETAAGISKVGKSADDLTAGVEDLKKELGPVTTAVDSAGDALGEAAEEADGMAENVKKIKEVQMAAVFSDIAGKIGDLAGKIAKAGPELDAAFGPEAAAKIRAFAEDLQGVSEVGSSIASGFAAGGPIGGALAGIATMLGKTGLEAVSLKTALDNASTAADRAAEMQAKLNEMLTNGVESQKGFSAAVLSDEISDQYTKQSEALKGLIDQLNEAKQITSAEDKVWAAQRDNADAAAIRGGAVPEDVKAKRAADDAYRAKSRIDYELKTEETLLRQKQKLADEAEAGSAKQKADKGSTPEQLAAAEKMAREAREAADEAQRKYDQNSTVKGLDKVAIDERATGKISGLQASKSTREEAEKLAAKAKADEAAAKVAADALRDSQLAELEAKRTKLAGTAAGNQAKIQGGGKNAGGLQDIGKDIGNADTEAEIAAVGEQIRAKQGELGAVTVAALKQMLEGQAALVREIAVIRQQIKNR